MAGLYVHVPFCKSRCNYCDFFSTTALHYIDRYVDAVLKEIQLKTIFLSDIEDPFTTIYFGGGTPSVLSPKHIARILSELKERYSIADNPEITLEANPESLSESYVEELVATGVNRVSLGMQSLSDEELTKLGRRHTINDVFTSVHALQKHNISNISIDLIYGLPMGSQPLSQAYLQTLFDLHIPHISAYCLTYEEGTPMTRLLQKGKIISPDDDAIANEYFSLCKILNENGYEHYEISNFALPGMESKHNSAYWQRIPYLGFGPAAHSYLRKRDGDEIRFSNGHNLKAYISAINEGHSPQTFEEHLSATDIYNEYVMLGLRTKRGIDLLHFSQALGKEKQNKLLTDARPFINDGILIEKEHFLCASLRGSFLIDNCIQALFI